MYCYNCGKEIPDDSLFCSFCGVSSSVEAPTKETNEINSVHSVNAIVCPQCGSADIIMENDKFGICESCGTKVSLSSNDTYNIYVNNDETESDIIEIYEIESKYSENDFKRFVLESLASDDSPMDVFESDFLQPKKKEHSVYYIQVDADIEFSASVGYDRKEPYLDTERYYDSSSKSYRERQVTKYKDVIDWSPFASSIKVNTFACSDANKDVDFDKVLFEDSLNVSEMKFLEEFYYKECPYYCDLEAQDDALSEIAFKTRNKAIASLPGDHYKDLNVSIADMSFEHRSLIKAPCYYMVINYNDTQYTKKLFPFGDYNVGGDEITGGLRESDSGIWKKIGIITLIVCAVMIASSICCLLEISDQLMKIGFWASIGLLVCHEILFKKIREKLATDYLLQKKELCEKKKRQLGL